MSEPRQVESNTESAIVKATRSTPLRPAVWMTSVLVWATVVALFLHVPTWAEIFLCVMTGLSFLSFLIPYIGLMIYNREILLREQVHVIGQPSLKRELLEPVGQKLIDKRPDLIEMETRALEVEPVPVIEVRNN